MTAQLDFHYDRGNGASFFIEHHGRKVLCFIEQENSFLIRKSSPGQSFPSIVERYVSLTANAAIINIDREGISQEPFGNMITAADIELAKNAKRV